MTGKTPRNSTTTGIGHSITRAVLQMESFIHLGQIFGEKIRWWMMTTMFITKEEAPEIKYLFVRSIRTTTVSALVRQELIARFVAA